MPDTRIREDKIPPRTEGLQVAVPSPKNPPLAQSLGWFWDRRRSQSDRTSKEQTA